MPLSPAYDLCDLVVERPRPLAAEPTLVLTKRALMAVYRERAARGEDIFHPLDLVQQYRRAGLDAGRFAQTGERRRNGTDGEAELAEG